MSKTNKKYFWFKLKEDFFRNKKIKKLRRIAGGDTYTIIYLKMQLLSLKDGGNLYFEDVEETFAEEIALEIDEDVDNVKVTLMFLLKNGLIEQIGEDEYSLIETKECIGSETASTIRSRKSRALKQGNEQKALHCNTLATNCNTEIDIEKDIDIEKEIEKDIDIDIKQEIYSPAEAEQPPTLPYQEIVDYLNERTGSSYRHTTKKTKDLIKARFNEGFTLDDFKIVIDKKTVEWLNDKNMNKYLRPETLFGTKFESYLNQQVRAMTTKDLPVDVKGFFS